jgi:hypothetical protein
VIRVLILLEPTFGKEKYCSWLFGSYEGCPVCGDGQVSSIDSDQLPRKQETEQATKDGSIPFRSFDAISSTSSFASTSALLLPFFESEETAPANNLGSLQRHHPVQLSSPHAMRLHKKSGNYDSESLREPGETSAAVDC